MLLHPCGGGGEEGGATPYDYITDQSDLGMRVHFGYCDLF